MERDGSGPDRQLAWRSNGTSDRPEVRSSVRMRDILAQSGAIRASIAVRQPSPPSRPERPRTARQAAGERCLKDQATVAYPAHLVMSSRGADRKEPAHP